MFRLRNPFTHIDNTERNCVVTFADVTQTNLHAKCLSNTLKGSSEHKPNERKFVGDGGTEGLGGAEYRGERELAVFKANDAC